MNYKTIPQVAKELQVSEDTIHRKAKQKNLLTDRIGNAWALSPGAVLIIKHTLRKPRTKKQGRDGLKGGRYASG
ncbi:MAG: hypothetical protein KA314_04950 [Chloroflexi bacterium]|nr:hypothetical protein [Chloroflexota bacterium]